MILDLNRRLDVKPEQIQLKPLLAADVSDAYVSWLNDPEINKFLEIRHQTPLTREAVVNFVTDCHKVRRHHWGIFVDNEHVGNVSCSYYQRLYNWVDISNLIGDKRYLSTNVAKFSLVSAMNYLFTVCGFNKISAGTYSNHLSGITLLTNVGFKKEAVIRSSVIFDGIYQDLMKFGILRSEWNARAQKFPFSKVLAHSWEEGIHVSNP